MNRRAVPIIAGALLVGVVVDLPFHSSPFPGYSSVIGLAGCILLILVAKKVLAPLVDRAPDIYPDDAAPDVQHDVWAVRAEDGPSRPMTEGEELAHE